MLNRQNTIINDLLGSNSDVLLVTGDYLIELKTLHQIDSISTISFTTLETINLHETNPDEYNAGRTFTPMFSKQIWQPNKFDKLLADIANDCLRVLFISIENNCLIAPYDGGMDIVLKDEKTRNSCQEKYGAWLSAREDGL